MRASSVFPENALSGRFVNRQIGPNEKRVRLPARVLRDEWHGPRAARIGIRSRGEIHRRHPLMKRVQTAGDKVEVSIAGLGVLKNTVEAE